MKEEMLDMNNVPHVPDDFVILPGRVQNENEQAYIHGKVNDQFPKYVRLRVQGKSKSEAYRIILGNVVLAQNGRFFDTGAFRTAFNRRRIDYDLYLRRLSA